MHTTTAPPDDASASIDLPTVLDVAAGYLEQHGWCFGTLYSLGDTDEPRACAIGALAVAVYGEPTNPRLVGNDSKVRAIEHASLAVLDWLGIAADPYEALGKISDWNDAVGRTPAQVIDTFRAVADEHRRVA